jgi:hypothetical protein
MSVDTIVLKIEEIEVSGKIDTTLYVFFDITTSEYAIRGSRRGSFYPYSFRCASQKDVSMFIENIIGLKNKVSYTLINYGDMPFDTNSIDFYYLSDNFDPEHNEIIGYDTLKLKYNDSYLKRYLRLLRVVFNYYEEV